MTFVYAVVLITMLSIAMDVSERMGKFITHKLSLSQIVGDYYLHFVPWINGELWPLFAFLSVIFFTSRMARDSEIIAMLSSGMHYGRILRPMIIAATLIAGVHWIGENYIIPPSTYHLNEFKKKYIKRSIEKVVDFDYQFYIAPGQMVYCRNYNRSDSSLTKFRLEQYDESGTMVSMLKADKLKYVDSTSSWRASHYEMRSFSGLEETLHISKDTPLDTALTMNPSDFILHTQQMEIMTTPDLRQRIISERAKGVGNPKSYIIEIYKRTSGPFTILILSIIGACIGTRKVRGGIGMHIALGVGLGAAFVVLSKFSETFATNLTLHPLLGVWIPNVLFGIIAIYLYRVAQK